MAVPGKYNELKGSGAFALELLAPARTADVGIDAVDAGADAVYIAGPDFGARKAAGNDFKDIARLCSYAHKFGVRIFVTANTIVEEREKDELHRQMLLAQEAGADAFIIREPFIMSWDDITIPLHASTQCAIRSVERARFFEEAGCERIVLERQLSLEDIRKICSAVNCEVEFFVHGALCTGYSGECRLSEYLDGRSADKGDCIQACRSLYDLEDGNGKTLVKNKALLSLKDYQLIERLGELADAGVCSFKIEGRLKNSSYVKNVVRQYSLALDALVAKYPGRYRRASFGKVRSSFTPDTGKTFNRGYTELFLDGKKDGGWSSMEHPKSMGEAIGTIDSIARRGNGVTVRIRPFDDSLLLNNGDGFAFVGKSGIVGFRGDVCSGRNIICKDVEGLKNGLTLYRNINAAFEKELSSPCKRMLDVNVDIRIFGSYLLEIKATCENGAEVSFVQDAGNTRADKKERMLELLKGQISKSSGQFTFSLGSMETGTDDGSVPFLSSAEINAIRRKLADGLSGAPAGLTAPGTRVRMAGKLSGHAPSNHTEGELFRSRYCVKYELGLCPVRQGAKDTGSLFLVNNGRRLTLGFDCKSCEMFIVPPGQN